MPELRSLIPSIEKAKMSQSTQDNSMLYENRLKSIDRFLQTIAETPELWTRDILIFIGIDKGVDQAVYLQKRHEIIQRKHKGIKEEVKEIHANPFGLPFVDEESSNRSESYHIDPEESHPISKEEIQLQLLRRSCIENLQKQERLSEFHSRKISSNTEINAIINEWRKSNEGEYIEYIIELSFGGGINKWIIAKRYSDFVFIHNKMLVSNDNVVVPKIPPKIDVRDKQQLENRMIQLEEYLNAYLTQYPINPLILEFCEFENSGSQIFRELSKMNIKTIECSIPGKFYKLSHSGDVDTYFEAEIRIYPQDNLNPMQIKIQITYELIRQFHTDLKLISRMGDIDMSSQGDLPSLINSNGEKVLDQQMMENIEEYLNRLQNNPSLLNLIVFKKFISDNIILDGEFECVDMKPRYSNNKKLKVLGSIRDAEEMFGNLDDSDGNDSEEEF